MENGILRKLPPLPTATSITPNKYKTPAIKTLDLSSKIQNNLTPTPGAEEGISAMAREESKINERNFYFNEKREDQLSTKRDDELYNYHNSKKMFLKKHCRTLSDLEQGEPFVLQEISNKVLSQQNEKNLVIPQEVYEKVPNLFKKPQTQENISSQSFSNDMNNNLDGMMEKVDSFYAEEEFCKNINSNRSDSISFFSAPSNVALPKNFQDSSFAGAYSEVAEFEEKFNRIEKNHELFLENQDRSSLNQSDLTHAFEEPARSNKFIPHSYLDLKKEIEKRNKFEKNQTISTPNNVSNNFSNTCINGNSKNLNFPKQKIINENEDVNVNVLREIVHQLQLKEAINIQNITNYKKKIEEYESEIFEIKGKYESLLRLREKDADYIKQLDSQQRRLSTKEDKSNEVAKLKDKIKCKDDIIYENFAQNQELKKRNKELEQVLKNILFERELGSQPNNKKNVKPSINLDDTISSMGLYSVHSSLSRKNGNKRSKSEVNLKRPDFNKY